MELIEAIANDGKLPVPNFAAGGIATPADAALMMQLGADSVFVGSGIFKSGDPCKPENYRGIAINSCIGKLFNCVLNNRLDHFLKEALPAMD